MTEREQEKLEMLRRRFIEWLEAIEYSPKTRVNYSHDVKEFIEWLSTDTGTGNIAEVTPGNLHQYQLWLYKSEAKTKGGEVRGLSAGSQSNKLAAIKKFFSWLVSEQQLAYNPAASIQSPRLPRRLPRNILTSEEARILIESTPIEKALDKRDRAILEVLYSAGLRRAELIDLKLYDVDLTGSTLRVEQGKGGYDRLIPMTESAKTSLLLYLSEARATWIKRPEQNHLFVSTRSGGPLDDADIVRIVQKGARRAGIMKHISPHLLRHSMATHMLKGGADIRQIQRLLGHRRLSSTEVYTHVEISDLQEVITRCHPREEGRSE